MSVNIRCFVVPIVGFVLASALVLSGVGSTKIPEKIFLQLHFFLGVAVICLCSFIFVIIWLGFSMAKNREPRVILIALSFFLVAVLNTGHIITYPGMFEPVNVSSHGESIYFSMLSLLFTAAALLIYLYPSLDNISKTKVKYSLPFWTFGSAILIVNFYTLDYNYAYFFIRKELLVFFGLISLLYLMISIMMLRNYKDDKDLNYFSMLNGVILILLAQISSFVYHFAGMYDSLTDAMIIFQHILLVSAFIYYFKAVFFDVIKKPYLDLNRSVNCYEKLSELGELAAGTVHEIRNPLTSIRGFIQVMQNKAKLQVGLSRRDIDKYTDMMLEEIDRTNKILSEFLLFAKPNEGRFEKCNFNDIVKDILPIIENNGLLKGVEVNTSISGISLPAYVNSPQIKQVLMNLANNAFEAMEDSSEKNLNIDCRLDSRNNQIVLSLSDTGCGIPYDVQERIFKPFFSTKENTKGTGLGLSVVQSIVANHGGTIELNSEPGYGTSFIIKLPCLTSKAELNMSVKKEANADAV